MHSLLLIRWLLLKVGNDVFGHQMILTLNQNGVQTRGVKVANGVETGVSRMRLTCGEGAGVQMTCEKPSAEAMLVSREINRDILKEVLTLCLAFLSCDWISQLFESKSDRLFYPLPFNSS